MGTAAEKGLSIVNRGDRRLVTVVLVFVGLAVGSFTTWATVNTQGEAFVDRRIELKIAPRLERVEKAIEEVQAEQKHQGADIAQLRTDVAVIKTMVTDMKESSRVAGTRP
jgi:hypothetical protein